jgi:hypothetical protein
VKRLHLTIRQRAWLGTLLLIGSIALITFLPNPLTFAILLVAGIGGMWLLMTAIMP